MYCNRKTNFFTFLIIVFAIQIIVASKDVNPYYEVLTYGLQILEKNCTKDNEIHYESIKNCAAKVFQNDTDKEDTSLEITELENPETQLIVGSICSPKNYSKHCISEHRQIIDSCPRREIQDFNELLHKSCMVNLAQIEKKSLLDRFYQEPGRACLRSISGYFEDCTANIRASYKKNPAQYNENCDFIKISLQCLYSGILACGNHELSKILNELSQSMEDSPRSNCYSELFKSVVRLPCCEDISDCNPLPNCKAEAGCCSVENCDYSDDCLSPSNFSSTCCPEGPGCNPMKNCNTHEGCCKDMKDCVFDPLNRHKCGVVYAAGSNIYILPQVIIWNVFLSLFTYVLTKF